MNSYKITYILNGEEHYDHITERTEKAAQKRVKGIYKDAEITDTELTSTDVNATKEQKREALEKIKAMVAELGRRATSPPPSRDVSRTRSRTSKMMQPIA